MKSLQAHFLVASPKLADPNFYKSVVLIIKHDDEGAMGLILNRPTEKTVREVWKVIAEEESDCEQPIFLGGPVHGPPVVLHRMKSAAEMAVCPGLYFSANPEKLEKIVAQKSKPFRFFIGYAGWAGGQLEDELGAGGWLTAKAKKDLIFHEGDDLWEKIVSHIGQDILGKAIKLKHVPDDPSLN
jgi:putative transcriptional regulator